MTKSKWVLIDQSNGAVTKDGSKLSPEALGRIAEAVQAQVNKEFSAEWGGQTRIRVGANPKDIKADEWGFVFYPKLPEAPDASAYHDISQKGVPYAHCALTTCTDLYGPNGVSVDVSHEILETLGDPGANLYADDRNGTLHAMEMCDAVEVQTYAKTCKDGTVVQVSNWLLQAWFVPGAKGPYDYMSAAKLPGAVPPPGPLQTAPGKGGNYQIICKATSTKDVFALGELEIIGKRRKGGKPHPASRSGLRIGLFGRSGRATGPSHSN